jgi:hypothetical protein
VRRQIVPPIRNAYLSSARFLLQSPQMQRRLGVAVADFPSPENEVAGCLKGNAIASWRHGLILRVGSILSINDGSHPL